jgi:hypothetical protein
MRVWIDEGRVPPDCLVWREGWRDWQQASTVFSQLRTDEEASQLEAIAAKSPSLPRTIAAGHPHPGRGRKATNTTLIVLLVVAAVILFAVFLWVLLYGPPALSMAGLAAIGGHRALLTTENRKPRREHP